MKRDGEPLSSEAASVGNISLAARIAEGDAAAESEFVSAFAPRIYMMGMVRIGDRETVRDLVQEVLISVICAVRKHQLQDAEKLPAFVAGTARNLINGFLRKKSRRPREEPLPPDFERAITDSEELDLGQRRILEIALKALNEDDRQLVAMILTDGLSPRQIAAKLGVTAEVVRTRKLRAVRRLAELVRGLSRS